MVIPFLLASFLALTSSASQPQWKVSQDPPIRFSEAKGLAHPRLLEGKKTLIFEPLKSFLSNADVKLQETATVGTQITIFSEPGYWGWYTYFRAPLPGKCLNLWGHLKGDVNSANITWNLKDNVPVHVVCGRINFWDSLDCKNNVLSFDIPGGYDKTDHTKFNYPISQFRSLTGVYGRTQSISCEAPKVKYPPPPPVKKRPPPPKGAKSPPPPAGGNANCLTPHNNARAELGIPGLVWNNTVYLAAKAWADQLAYENCAFYHGGNDDMGQNIYWSPRKEANCSDATRSFVGEKAYYTYGPFPDYCQSNKVCGHYTQVVWRNTKSVGCAKSNCADGSSIWVCNYYPPGNYARQYPW